MDASAEDVEQGEAFAHKHVRLSRINGKKVSVVKSRLGSIPGLKPVKVANRNNGISVAEDIAKSDSSIWHVACAFQWLRPKKDATISEDNSWQKATV